MSGRWNYQVGRHYNFHYSHDSRRMSRHITSNFAGLHHPRHLYHGLEELHVTVSPLGFFEPLFYWRRQFGIYVRVRLGAIKHALKDHPCALVTDEKLIERVNHAQRVFSKLDICQSSSVLAGGIIQEAELFPDSKHRLYTNGLPMILLPIVYEIAKAQ